MKKYDFIDKIEVFNLRQKSCNLHWMLSNFPVKLVTSLDAVKSKDAFCYIFKQFADIMGFGTLFMFFEFCP